MGGFGNWLKDTVASGFNVIAAPVRAVGHTVMEVGRGVKEGDWGRVAMAPVKGVGHGVAETYREGVRDPASWWWQPSKMRQWMSPAGTALLAAGSIPSPFTPFLLAGGAALSAGGAIGEGVYQKDVQGRATSTQKIQLAEEQKKNNMWLIAGAGILGVSALMLLK